MPNTAVEYSNADWLHVVAAVIRNDTGQVLLAQRPHNKHQGGKWEFPGGKVEQNETAKQALQRELKEELGIDVVPETIQPFAEVRHRYSDKSVFLDVWLVEQFSGEPQGQEGQPVRWFVPDQLGKLDFPAANAPILEQLLK